MASVLLVNERSTMYTYHLFLRIGGAPVTLVVQAPSREATIEVAANVWDMYDNSPNPAHEVRQGRPA